MVRIIKICIYAIVGILLLAGVTSLISIFFRFEPLEIEEKIALIEEGNAVRGGETSQSAIINEETNTISDTKYKHVRLSDSKPLDTLQLLFASLALNDIDQFIFSFNVETILIEFQSLDEQAKEKIADSMLQITRNNTINNIEYNKLKDNRYDIRISYEDDKQAKVSLQLDQTTSIIYESEPTFYNIVTPVSEIIEQIETTIQ